MSMSNRVNSANAPAQPVPLLAEETEMVSGGGILAGIVLASLISGGFQLVLHTAAKEC